MTYSLVSNIEGKDNVTLRKRSMRVAVLMFVASLAFVIPYYYLAYQGGTWQMFALATLLLAYSLVVLASIGLIRRDKPIVGIRLILVSMFILFPASVFFVAGNGLVLGVSLIVIVSVIAVYTLPEHQSNQAIIASIIVAIMTLLIDIYLFDWLELTYRLEIPAIRRLIPVVAGILVMIYGFYVARQFGSYSLRTKLVVAFLMVSLLSLAVVAFVTNRSTSTVLTENVGIALNSQANTQALTAGELLVRQIEALQSLSLSRSLRDRLIQSNLAYGDDAVVNQATLEALNRQWMSAEGDTEFVVQSRLRNRAATELLVFQNAFPDHVQLLLTDRLGGIMATTEKISTFYFANEAWWQAADNDGQGSIYVSIPMFDEESDTFGLVLAVPVYDDDGDVLGIMRSIYSLEGLGKALLSVEAQELGVHTDIIFPNGQLLAVGENELEEVELDLLATLEAAETEVFSLFDFEGIPSIVTQASMTTVGDDPEVTNLGWSLVLHQDEEIALAPVQAQTRNNVLLAMLVAGIAVVAALLIAQRLTRPILQLSSVAEEVSAGELSARADVETGDEIGMLAASFNSMTSQLEDTIVGLEDRVAERTRQLELVLDLGQRLASILDLSELMQEVVTSTKETFNFYHVHIYLLNQDGSMLVLAEGYGQAGIEMKRQGHSIPLTAPKGLVARAARNGEVVYISDVAKDPTWLPNRLLPDTQSEMAVPIVLGSEVVGVLDVQSDTTDGLTREDGTTLQLLANQIAVAIRNARLFAETREALQRAEKLQELYTGAAWQTFGAGRQKTNFEIRQTTLPSLEEITTPEAETALETERTTNWSWTGGDGAKPIDGNVSVKEEKSPATGNALATPLKLNRQVIGILGIRDNRPDRRWTEDEISLIEAVSEQMSLALENARLFEETGRRAVREKIIADMTRQIWASGDLEKVMQTAVEQFGSRLEASKVIIRLGTEDQLLTSSKTRGD